MIRLIINRGMIDRCYRGPLRPLDSQGLDGGNQFVSFYKRLPEVRKHALKAIFVRDDLIKEVFRSRAMRRLTFVRVSPRSAGSLSMCAGASGLATGLLLPQALPHQADMMLQRIEHVRVPNRHAQVIGTLFQPV
jgi:hypothetical protein